MDQPLVAVRGRNFHLVVYAFKDQVCNNALESAVLRLHKIDILRPDHHVDRLVVSESFIHTGEFRAEDLHKLVVDHRSTHDIALADKVRDKGIFRLIVDLLRRSHLLDITLVHDNDRVGHRERLFLVVGDIDKGDSQLIFQADQLILHVLAELQVESAERLVEKQKFRLVYDRASDGNPLLLAAA